MADATGTTEATTAQADTATEDQNEQQIEGLGDAGKKALDAERRNARAAAKERDALAARLKEFEDRDKSEADKLAERATAAETRAVEFETRALRLEVAAEKGLTPAQAKRLVGTTRDELEADAAELLDTFKPAAIEDRSAIRADLDLGTRGTTATATGNPGADFAKFLNKQLAG